MVGAEPPKGVVLVLLPVGRDALTVAGLIERTGLRPEICNTLREVVENLDHVVEVVLVAEEALYGNNVRVLADWVGRHPPWSDQPFVVLTNPNDGPKFAAFRRELVTRLRNVGFLERPLQAITLQATLLSAGRTGESLSTSTRGREGRTAPKGTAGRYCGPPRRMGRLARPTAAEMKDYLASIEKLRRDAAEAALIRDLATDTIKRGTFDRLHEHLNRLADEIERALNSAKTT
jgi:hypothetical protein